MANKAIHRTAVPLRSIRAGELGCCRPTIKAFYALLLFAIVVLVCDGTRAEVESLPFRGSERGEIAHAREIVDGQWIVTGNSERQGADNPSANARNRWLGITVV